MSFDADYILSDSDIDGNFSFTNYRIRLFEDDLAFIGKLKKNDNLRDYKEALKKFSTIIHEFRHYFDMTHTVYGVSYLHDLNYSLQLKYKSDDGAEFNYYKIKEFRDAQKRIKYPNYYHQLFDNENLKKWKLIPSIGRTFDSTGKVSKRPVLFARYYNMADKPLARHPFSMVSLLECSASIDEYINSIYLYRDAFKDLPEKLKYVEGSFSEATINQIYDIKLTEYSTCFHLVANHFRYPELQDVFDITRILVDLCLNMTDKHFEELEKGQFIDSLYKPAPSYSTSELSDYIAFFECLKLGIEHKERPILFYALIQSLRPQQYNRTEFIAELDRTLEKYKLTYNSIMKDAKIYIIEKSRIISNSKIKLFSLIGNSIAKNFSTLNNEISLTNHDRTTDIAKIVKELDFPCIDVNDQFFDFTNKPNNVFNGADYNLLFNEVDALNVWLDEFCDACF